jgi:hypothetical protein
MPKVACRLRLQGILEQLGHLFIYRGLPEYIRSDNGGSLLQKLLDTSGTIRSSNIIHRIRLSLGEWIHGRPIPDIGNLP